MKLSSRGEYALRALLVLGLNYGQSVASILEKADLCARARQLEAVQAEPIDFMI